MHRDESLRCFLVLMDTDFDLLHTARNLSAPASPGSRFQSLWESLTKAHVCSGFTRSLTASPRGFAMPGAPGLPEAVHKEARLCFVELVTECHGLLLEVRTTAGNEGRQRLHRGAI